MMKESLDSPTRDSQPSPPKQRHVIDDNSFSKDERKHHYLADSNANSSLTRHRSPTKSRDKPEEKEEGNSSSNAYCTLLSLQTFRSSQCARTLQNPLVKKLLSLIGSVVVILLLKRLMNPDLLHNFLIWMEEHPIKGLAAYMIIYPLHMVLILPGTPLCMGAGFVFKLRYGWIMGVIFGSFITLLGSLIGSIICFLMGRYCFRSSVRRWSKKYPLFDPIDHAVSDNGFKVMVLVYLTPAVPLGPISYMMGTTSMPLIDFAKAKIAALPMTVLYVYLGAATGTLMTQDESENDNLNNIDNGKSTGTVHKANMEEMALSPKFLAAGILLSIVIIAIISVKMKKELQKILDKHQKKSKDEDDGKMSATISSGNARQRVHNLKQSNVDESDLRTRNVSNV